MFGASQCAVGDHARPFERLLHVRTNRRNGPEAAAVVHNDELDAIYQELLQRIGRDVGGLTDALPTHGASLSCGRHTPPEQRGLQHQIGQCEPLSNLRFSRRTSRLRKRGLPFSSLNVSMYRPTRNSRLSPASMCEFTPSSIFWYTTNELT